MSSFTRRALLIAVVLAALSTLPAFADVKAGAEAWRRGDYPAAIAEWRAPADAGDANAQFNLGQAYKLGRGVPADLAVAAEWYRKAAAQGHVKAGDQYGFVQFQRGDRRAAMPWIRKAADRGEPRALYVLGIAYFNGDFVARDRPRGYAMMTRAAEAGIPEARTSLAEMSRQLPVEQRQSKAWRVQLGAFSDEARARALWTVLAPRVAALGGFQPQFIKAGRLTRIQTGPVIDKAAAEKLCAAIAASGNPCLVIAP